MPEVGTIDIEPARDVIRRVFLERIVDGKGLSSRRRRGRPRTAADAPGRLRARPDDRRPRPGLGGLRPHRHGRGHDRLLLPHEILPRRRRRHPPRPPRADAEAHGRRRPGPEGLGRGPVPLRGSPSSKAACGRRVRPRPAPELRRGRQPPDGVSACRRRAAGASTVSSPPPASGPPPSATPASSSASSRRRGASRSRRGKDLRQVRRLVGSGGYLAGATGPDILLEACAPGADDPDTRHLVPEAPACYADAEYLIPLLGNLAADFPAAAARAAVAGLKPLTSRTNGR